jgi:BirA family biotin operon repressor/biotin-[acetyl-CoA-carboxylase] ligase
MSVVDREQRLSARELRDALGDCQIGNQLLVVEEAVSTNDLVWEAEKSGTLEGFVALAESQTAGRGQYGRQWQSTPFKGLYLSILLRPKMTLAESPRLTFVLAKAVAATIEEQTGQNAQIKPPNDIYLGGRKTAGVLVEGRTTTEGTYVAVAGIGINVNQTIDDFPEEIRSTAGSLASAIGHQVPRADFAVALLKNLEKSIFNP